MTAARPDFVHVSSSPFRPELESTHPKGATSNASERSLIAHVPRRVHASRHNAWKPSWGAFSPAALTALDTRSVQLRVVPSSKARVIESPTTTIWPLRAPRISPAGV